MKGMNYDWDLIERIIGVVDATASNDDDIATNCGETVQGTIDFIRKTIAEYKDARAQMEQQKQQDEANNKPALGSDESFDNLISAIFKADGRRLE